MILTKIKYIKYKTGHFYSAQLNSICKKKRVKFKSDGSLQRTGVYSQNLCSNECHMAILKQQFLCVQSVMSSF